MTIKRGMVASGSVLLAVGMAVSTGTVGAQDATIKPALWITADRMLDVGVNGAGRWADLVAVPGDPTHNVALLLESVPLVMKGADVVKDGR